MEPRFRRHRRPISVSPGFLAPTLQRPMPYFTYPPQNATQRVRAEVQSEVLVMAVEHLRQVGLLDSAGLVTVHLDPQVTLRTKRSRAFTLGVRPMVIVPRRVFVK